MASSRRLPGKRKRCDCCNEHDSCNELQPRTNKRRKMKDRKHKKKCKQNDDTTSISLQFNDQKDEDQDVSKLQIKTTENSEVKSSKNNMNDTLTFKYISDFDENGLIYYLGTDNKTNDIFTNPAKLGLVITSSTDLLSDSKCSDYIVDRKIVRLITKPKENAFIIIDIKPSQYEILPTFYTLRHYKTWDTETLRNWYFEGSNDNGRNWDILYQHNNDTSLQLKGQSFTWKIDGVNRYYSMFRILQFGTNSNHNHYLACSGFEIYGDCRKIYDDEDDSDIEILPNTPIKINKLIIPTSPEKQVSTIKQDRSKEFDRNYNHNKNQMAYRHPTKLQLLDMGYDEYFVDESVKYVTINGNYNADNLLLDAMDWLNNHEITEHEIQNNNILKICNIIECTRYQALYALKQCNNNIENALNMLVNADNNNNNNNNDNNEQNDNIFTNLSQEEVQNLQLEDSILSATLLSIDEQRKKEEQFKKLKPLIISELRSMGFLQIAANRAVNDKTVKDKKSAIQYILNHPMNGIQEKHAKIQEITNCGYTENDANTALNRFSQNLNMSTSWLMQGKPDKIKHFIYHIETKQVMQTAINNDDNILLPELSENINFKNNNQHWSLYENGKIKNFATNKILAVKWKKEEINSVTIDSVISYDLILIFDDILDIDNIDNKDEEHDDNDNNNNNIFRKWEIDYNEKTIKNKGCGLYLVFRNDSNNKIKFYLERNIHSGDMSQRWCFIDENELTKINPKELAKLLDSTEFECVICWENEPNLRFEPCGHSTFCESCINELKPTECPICRTKIHSSRTFE